jgi:hypothetical protein
MAFIQIMECQTTEPDTMRALTDEWDKATEGVRTARRAITTQDRDDPNRYFVIVFFDSYESAMENSELPETKALAEKMGAVVGDPVFHNLEVLEDRS